MKGLLKQVTEAGMSISEFTRKSDLSFPTLKRIDKGKPVRPDTLAKAMNALKRAQAQASLDSAALV